MKNIGINGYGTIGKRVADAVSAQDDMKIVGVTKRSPDYEAKSAVEKGYDLYISVPEREAEFEEAGIEVAGTADELFEKLDLVVDCTPGGVGAQNKTDIYEKIGLKAIFEGGEDHDAIGCSFNAEANYSESIGQDYVRVVSCNTTGLCRTLKPVYDMAGINKVRAVMVRRGADPNDAKRGPINAIVPSTEVPSHHGPDVQTIIKDLSVMTMALIVPTTLMHTHNIMVDLKDKSITKDDVLDAFEDAYRVLPVKKSLNIASTAQIMEYAKELGRSRSDMYEIPVWEESINVVDGELFYMQAVHQESDVVPENVDAIRAMLELEDDAEKSILKTNKAMGIL